MTTPYGVTGCRCAVDSDGGEARWTANPHCPYHGINAEATVPVPDTGTYLVRNGVVEQGHFDSFGRWCADDDCEITHG